MNTPTGCTKTDANWKITVSKDADKRIRSLDQVTRRRIGERLRKMREDPHSVTKRLVGFDDLWSSRVGDWRIICTIADEVKVIAVIWVARRGQVYDDVRARF